MNGRLVIGRGVAAPGSIARLAVRIADHARIVVGFRLESLRRSRWSNSQSCYLAFADRAMRRWIVRVSDHHREPHDTCYPVPHFELIAIDGVSGFDHACGTLARMADGTMPWHDAEAEIRLPRARKAR